MLKPKRIIKYVVLFIVVCYSTRLMAADSVHQCDVLVYGATPAGVCAAIGAAREGASVILLEPTTHVGGVNTGGLSFSDSNQTVRKSLGGLFEEWHLRIEQDYKRQSKKLTYQVKVKDHSAWTYEPHVAMRVTKQMLKEAKVKVFVNRPELQVKKQETNIVEISTGKEERFVAQVYVDATYEGDLMAASGVSWVIGREGRDEFNESLAGKRYKKPLMKISGFNKKGDLLPLITTSKHEKEGKGDRNVMVYSYRLCLTDQPENRIPFPKPKQYDPKRFEVVRRYFRFETNERQWMLWDLYPLPGGKYDANNGIHKQFSMGIVGYGNEWCEANWDKRKKMQEEYKQYTLEMYHFLTTDLGVPEKIRRKFSKYGLCKDEFTETKHWSPQLYVREGRRMRGLYVVTQNDILKKFNKPDSIAISSFPIDSHDCARIALLNKTVFNEGTIFPSETKQKGTRHGPASQIPYRSLLPKQNECTNLLVPVALSSTHVAYSSIRVEPTWMVIGHSSGVAAAIAAKTKSDVQKVPYHTLRKQLLLQKQIVDLPDN